MSDKNFKVRTIVTALLAVIAILSLLALDGAIFKGLYIAFATIAAIELLSFFKRKFNLSSVVIILIELAFLVGSIVYALSTDIYYYIYVMFGVPGYDIFAYLFGKALGGKIFGKSRPFPKISKNKTWEGTLFGIFMSALLVLILLVSSGAPINDYIYLLCGPLALIGDLYESWLKRRFNIKDSNEIVVKNPVFSKIEYIVGGTNGHGGFLDRVDSVAFTATIILILTKLLAL